MRLAVFALGLAALAVASADAAAQERLPPPPPKAWVKIVSPKRAAVVPGKVEVKLDAQGVSIRAANGTRETGIGHHHLYLDMPVTPVGQTHAESGQLVHLADGATSHVFFVTPGKHRIIAAVAYGNHVLMEGVAQDTVDVVVGWK
ncbi:MAG: DUF4399 domain-containing protein [Gemmatimonadales bacterium]|nr:DUF4399 domain-containing protein [Gemmatimonadales bacterium]